MNLLAAVDQSSLHTAGPVADRMQYVYTWVWYGSLALGSIVTVLLLVSFFRFRRKSDDEEPEQVHGNTRLEIAWTAIPFAILFMLFIITAVNMPFINNQSTAANAVNLQVEGQQFQWAVKYPGGQQMTNVIIVPTGVPVNINLTSSDVNHSLFLPNLAGQMNAIPGQTNTMWLQADHDGVFYGQCTELCGYGHEGMLVAVVSLPQSQYNSCLAGSGPFNLQDISKGKNKDCAPKDGGFS